MARKQSSIPKWIPRNGKRLMEERERSRLEGYAARRLTHVRKVIRYPLVAVVIGAIVTTTIHRYLMARSIGLLLIAIWLAVDIWEWLLRKERKQHQWRFVIGWSSTSVLLVAVMLIMAWMLNGVLEDDRSEVLDKLTIDYSMPDESNPNSSVISITNGSSHDISGRHRIVCNKNLEVSWDGLGVTQNIGLTQNGPHTWTLFGGQLVTPIKDTGIIIHGGGDAQSDSCMAAINWGKTDCSDMTIRFQYFLADQPSAKQEKSTRIVTHVDGHGGFKWYKQPLDTEYSPCASFIKRP